MRHIGTMARAAARMLAAVAVGMAMACSLPIGGGSLSELEGAESDSPQATVGEQSRALGGFAGEARKRQVISLDGTWNLAASASADTIPAVFPASVPVPGLVEMASPVQSGSHYWYRAQVNPGASLPAAAFIKFNKGMYGKSLWINGQKVGDHYPNFTPVWFDVSGRLTAGAANTVVVRVGTKDTLPAGVNTGTDYEKQRYTPGIYDSVSLVLTGSHVVDTVRTQTLADLAHLRVVVAVKNRTAQAAAVPVTLELRTSAGAVAGTASATVQVPANGSAEADLTLSVANAQPWTPETPNLYDLKVSTDNDDDIVRVGLRTFGFDQVSKKPLLNGQPYFLRGTNVTMYRFFEDSERGALPWNKEWVRTFIRLWKSLNMNSARYCIGFPPEIWYEVADEEGFAIMDEYPIWRMNDPLDNGATAESMLPEVRDWMKERSNHASVILWDMCNETNNAATGAMIDAVRSWDLQNRPWDNGWGPGRASTDTREQHLYFNQMYEGSNAGFSWTTAIPWTPADLERETLRDQNAAPAQPFNVNEYGWIWLNRQGDPTWMTKDTFAMVLPGSTLAQRKDYNARQVAMESEWFRANRHAIVQHFVALGYNRATDAGVTSDSLEPGVATPTVWPSFKKLVGDAFAPVGIMVGWWKPGVALGSPAATVPVHVVNDSPAVWTGTVTLKVMNGTSVVSSSSKAFTGVPVGVRVAQDFTVAWPTTAGSYQLVAEYAAGSGTVQSVRQFRVDSDYALNGWAKAKAGWSKSVLSGYPLANLNDGFNSTRWSSNYCGNSGAASDWEWVVLDLGASRSVSRVKLLWEAAYASQYDIAVSNDWYTWTTLKTVSAGDGGLDDWTGLSGSGRYIRLQCKKLGVDMGGWGNYSLHEFQVW